MRALVVHPGPAFSVADVHHGWLKGLRAQLGADQVQEYALQNRLYFFAEALIDRDGMPRRAFTFEEAARLAMKEVEAACYEWWPDLVVVISGFYLNPFICELMRARGHKVVLVHTESPYEDTRQLTRAPWVDLNVLNDPTNIDRFQAVAPTIYLPHSYDPELHRPQPATAGMESDFVFVGTGYESRIDFFEEVDFAGVDAKLAGNWQQLADTSPLRGLLAHDVGDCCDNDDAVRYYTSSKASVNLYRAEALHPELVDGWAMGPREVELAACGTFFLRDPRGEGDELLPMLPTFDGPGDFAEQLRWWLAHDDERAAVALKAREAVADRTFERSAAELLSRL